MKTHHIIIPFLRILRKFSVALVFALYGLFLNSCKVNESDVAPAPDNVAPANKFSAEVATKWADLQLLLTKTTAGYTPPVASRAYGLAGLTMYEAVVGGLPSNQSLAGQLSALTTLPKSESGKDYNWALSANAAEATLFRSLYAEASRPQAVVNKRAIDSLELVLKNAYKTSVPQDIVDRSEKLGQDIANAIFDWSKTDGGHEGYKRNFPVTYVVPVFDGAWQTTENGQKIPMQPTWGTNRTFVPANQNMAMPTPIPFSSSLASPYYSAYLEVYTKSKSLTDEEKAIAVWWADNPVETFTPPGHSYNIANIVVKQTKAGLGKAAEAFARTGISVNDAFIFCWKIKFEFNNERPYTMLRRTVDPKWAPFWSAPPFPGFPSGHATQSSAASAVLTDFFGDHFAFMDDSHLQRGNDAITGVVFKARFFKSFSQFATESANSRFYGGIHTRQDNETGLLEGEKVGKNVIALKFKK
jgi:hypothetical protein